jgi:hypothetical protein
MQTPHMSRKQWIEESQLARMSHGVKVFAQSTGQWDAGELAQSLRERTWIRFSNPGPCSVEMASPLHELTFQSACERRE